MFDDVKGFIICKGLEVPSGVVSTKITNDVWMVDHRLHKFKEDEILWREGKSFYFLDGYVLNKDELCRQKQNSEWNDTFIKLIDDKECPIRLRGAFCGFWGNEKKITFFVDHVGNRGLYYYSSNGLFILASNIYFIVELLKYHHILLTISEQAVKYMLEQGFMLDHTTYADEIKRVCPGEIIEVEAGRAVNRKRYYLIDNTIQNFEMPEKEIIENIDFFFRQAVQREFDKDKEYGYKHLVDLSGGLDSRMTCWCAHDMGYSEQVNFTYCRKDYLDFKIAQEIAVELKHNFLFMPLDDFQWYKEVEEITRKNNGAALYMGITGGNRFLQLLNCELFGIEHTGMVGDAILSTFYTDERYNYGKPVGDENAYSQLVRHDIPQEIMDDFSNREQFSVYTRGLLGAQSSYFIRQNYLETASPFLDVDFLDFVFQIPFKYRKQHYIYLKWIESKYPKAAEYGWEKWFGVKPQKSKMLLKHLIGMVNQCVSTIGGVIGHKSRRGMNPVDYWLDNDIVMKEWLDSYFRMNKKYLAKIPEMKDEIINVFNYGNATEKTQAITALVLIKYVSY